jgi:hypothetical protein
MNLRICISVIIKSMCIFVPQGYTVVANVVSF